MGKEMISEQVTIRKGQRGFVGPDGKWYPIAGQTPATPNFGERLPGESTADFHKRLRGNLPPVKPKPKQEPEPEPTKVEPEPETTKVEPKPEPTKVEPTKGPKLVWNKERMDFDGPETTATPTPKPEPAKVEPTPAPAPKPEGVSAGLKKWASIYGAGGPKQLKQFTPSQRRLFRYTHPSTEKPMGEAYDVVLDYLLSEGHADTVEEAHYVMMQLDAEYVQSIVEDSAPVPNIPPEKPKDKERRKPPADTPVPPGDGQGPEEGGVYDREVRVPPNSYGDLRVPPNKKFDRSLGVPQKPVPPAGSTPRRPPNTTTKPKPRKPIVSLYPGEKNDGLLGPYLKFGNNRIGIPNISPVRPDNK